MKNFLVSLFFLFPTIFTIILVILTPIPSAQLTPSETRILLQLQTLLEFPQVLHKWNNLTNFCNIPSSPSFSIICSKNHITELTIIGNKTKQDQFLGVQVIFHKDFLLNLFSLF
ncbi:hypothetical protein P8452_47454 [Trifolium repens]|nr:hypothetical protein P8452_47454 [Trifolium repens]